MLKRYTIHQIKAANEAVGSKFFSKENLRFAGQTVKMFSVKHAGDRVFLYAVRYPGRVFAGYTIVEFHPATGQINTIPGVMHAYQLHDLVDKLKAEETLWK